MRRKSLPTSENGKRREKRVEKGSDDEFEIRASKVSETRSKGSE